MNVIDLTRQRNSPVYQLVALLEELGAAVAVTDGAAQLLHINLSAQRMLGIVGENACGANLGEWVEELAAAPDLAQALSEYAMIPGGEGNGSKPVTLRHRNGHTLRADCVVCRTDFEGTPVFVCLFRDESELHRAREQMLDAQRLVRSILQNTSEGYVLIDASGMITDTNPAFEAMCGRNAMDLLDSRFDRLFDGRGRRTIEGLVTKLEKGRTASAEVDFVGAEGEARLGLFKGAPLFDANNERVGIFGLITDITEAKEKERKIEQLAYFDPLTELANRSLLRDKLEQATMFSQRSQRKFALLFLDLDRFKHVNDTYNHPLGDLVLQEVAQRIRQVVRRSDVVSRFGGDEFVIGLVEPRRIEDVALVAEKLLEIVAQPLLFDTHTVHITTSIGISVFPDDASSVDELIRNADLAMYQAKEEGRARYSYFTETLNARVRRQRELEKQMRLALARKEFVLYYQPKVDGASGRIVGAEALIRWQSPEMGFVSPVDFIPLAEETGMIVPLGEWVLRQAGAQVLEWKRQGLPLVPVSVNVSGMQLHHSDFKLQLQRFLADMPGVTEWLELEITESTLMKDVEMTIALLHELCEMGFLLSVDDFGTGYSSFSYLTRFPIHTIKIDKSFVCDLPYKKSAVTIVSAIAGMANSLGLKTVAEGVETREQAQYLTDLGCDQLQGYYYSRPVPVTEFSQLLAAGLIQP